jgi:hypothetical protein
MSLRFQLVSQLRSLRELYSQLSDSFAAAKGAAEQPEQRD